MVDMPNNNIDPTDKKSGNEVNGDSASGEQTDRRRRELLNVMKGAAIAGPILMTLKNTPAMATTQNGSNVSAGNSTQNNFTGLDHRTTEFNSNS